MTREEQLQLIKAASALGIAKGLLGGAARLGVNALPVAGAAFGAHLAAQNAPDGSAVSSMLPGAIMGGTMGLLGRAGALRTGKALRSRFAPGATPPPAPTKTASASLDPTLAFNFQIPGLPFGVKLDDVKSERLPGMSHWVPRNMLTEALKQEKTPEELEAEAANAGLARHAGMGALLGVAGIDAARRLYPEGLSDALGSSFSGRGGLVRGAAGLTGALAGLAYNRFTANDRREQMRDAIQAAEREREKFPLAKREESASHAVAPMLLNSGSGEG
jgi:hypothetical protein